MHGATYLLWACPIVVRVDVAVLLKKMRVENRELIAAS